MSAQRGLSSIWKRMKTNMVTSLLLMALTMGPSVVSRDVDESFLLP